MVDASAVTVSADVVPGNAGTYLKINYTKANATDVLNIPTGYGETVVWIKANKRSTLVDDPPTAVTDLAVTMSAGTGAFTALVLLE